MTRLTWVARTEDLSGGRGKRFTIDVGTHAPSRPATFAEVLRGWQGDAGWRTLFNSLLADAPYTAFRWETLAVTAATASRPFEFALLDSPDLDRRVDQRAFSEHFGPDKTEVVTFSNLGGDATLVVPCPVTDASAYGHLAAFVRHAPESQWHALWQSVGGAMAWRVGERPVWLSTAGAGVSWLHVRLDDRPKYYAYGPYRQSA